MYQQHRAIAIFFALATAIFVLPLFAAAPTIEDNGGFFSKSALDQGNRIVDEIYEETRPLWSRRSRASRPAWDQPRS